MKKTLLLSILLLLAVSVSDGQPTNHTLYQKPTVSRTQIAFVYAGDLWTVSREGGRPGA